MQLVAAAKNTGCGDKLWPAGTDSETVSDEFISVLNHCLFIMNLQENLPSDEMPPKWMWHLDWEIETHMKLLKSKREAKYGGGSSSPNDDELSETYESENILFDEMKKRTKVAR